MHKTLNDLPVSVRETSIQLLNSRLADSFDLYSQIKQAHWTVRGLNFIALHELFDKVATNVLKSVDLIAERIQQLGGTAQGTIRESSKKSSLPEYPLTITSSVEHIQALLKAMSHFSCFTRKNISELSETDVVTADMLTEIMRNMDRDLWFIESHLDLS